MLGKSVCATAIETIMQIIMHDFRKLQVWQMAVNLCVEMYKLTSNFPREELFGLKAQINRSVVSIASNIAEGAGRNSTREFSQFLSYAIGSCYELETQLIIAEKLLLVPSDDFERVSKDLQTIEKMIFNLKKQLNQFNKEDKNG